MKKSNKNKNDVADDKSVKERNTKMPTHTARDTELSKQEAEAGAPDNYSVAGEEDPGVGLEFLVEKKITER